MYPAFRKFCVLACFALLFSACGRPDILAPPCASGVCVSKSNALTVTAVVATDKESWVYLDLDTGKEVKVTDPMKNKTWDLAFQRYRIKSNSGISGKGGVGVAIVDRKTLKELAGTNTTEDFDLLDGPTLLGKVTKAPKTGYVSDMDDEDGDGDEDLVFLQEGAWYDYDFGKHILTPKKRVFIVRTTEKKYFKVLLRSYYSSEGYSGTMSFWSSELLAP